MDKVVLDGQSLTIGQVIAVATGQPGKPEVILSEAAKVRVERAARAVAQLLARGEIAYGVTTGFGAFKDRLIPPDQVGLLQRNIIFSHAAGVGDPFDRTTTRAIMLIRANTLARGFNKLPETIGCSQGLPQLNQQLLPFLVGLLPLGNILRDS